jgi:hypothetical protein
LLKRAGASTIHAMNAAPTAGRLPFVGATVRPVFVDAAATQAMK